MSWSPAPDRLGSQFRFLKYVGQAYRFQNVRGVVRIYYGQARAPIGRIMFMFKIAEAGAPAPTAASIPSRPPQEALKYTHAFISYCSQDRRQVLMGLRGLRKGWKLAGITDTEIGQFFVTSPEGLYLEVQYRRKLYKRPSMRHGLTDIEICQSMSI